MWQIIFTKPLISSQRCGLKLAKSWDKVWTKTNNTSSNYEKRRLIFWHSGWIACWCLIGDSNPFCYRERAMFSGCCLWSLNVSGVWRGALGIGALTWKYYKSVLILLSLAYFIVTFTTTVLSPALSLFSKAVSYTHLTLPTIELV